MAQVSLVRGDYTKEAMIHLLDLKVVTGFLKKITNNGIGPMNELNVSKWLIGKSTTLITTQL